MCDAFGMSQKRLHREPFLLRLKAIIGGYGQVKLGVPLQNHQPAEPR